MKKSFFISMLLLLLSSFVLKAQNAIQVGAGSYAEYPPQSVWDEDGYFAKTYRWFHDNWSSLYLHANARQKPLPTNKWWTNYVFSQYGGDAWAYPHAVSADQQGINIKIPSGFQGGGMILDRYLSVRGASQLQTNDEAVVFADFESTSFPAGWTVAPNPAYQGPVALADINQNPAPNGYTGNRFVDSYKGNEAKLSLTSPSFVISKKYIRLRVGGGNYLNDTYVGLFINGVRVLAETGENSGTLTLRTWDVSAYAGQTAEIRIVDNSTAGWGFIMCDEIVFSDSSFAGTGYPTDFAPLSSNVYDWSDLGFTFRSEDANGRYMNVSLVHGVPFTWIQLHDLVPVIVPGGSATVYDISGNEITDFPVQTTACTLEFGGRVYGLHLPSGSRIYKSKGGDFQIEIPAASSQYLVISNLPQRNFLSLYDTYARNLPQNTGFSWDYRADAGKVSTTFTLNTKNLDTGTTGGASLMSFLPHHYRNTTSDFNFISGADYQLIKGKMHTAAGSEFTINYDFNGLLPYLPEPLDLTETQQKRLNDLIAYRASASGGYNGNTYAKGLGEESNMMLMAKVTGNNGYATLKNNLKSELQDWLTYSPSESSAKQYYFAKYPDYGAVIGFPPGYGSQGFNDLHFHYGYFTVGSARLMMVDNDFKRNYGDMAKLIVKSFCNWKHYPDGGDYLPFMRTFDPYFGHSFAGGTGDGGGNNQESTSEAVHSWFGIYLMGLELNDPEIYKLGAMGYLLETTAATEYWMDMYDENFPSTFGHEYAGIVRTDNLGWATYFSGDPAWILGIQGVPCDFYYNTYLGKNPAKMKSIWESMISDRTTVANPPSNTTDPFQNIMGMGSYLGGYQLNLMNTFDPQQAALFTDSLYKKGGEWTTDVNMATEYYTVNSILTYGAPADGYYTSIPSGAVYKNYLGELTYLLYNPTNQDVDVNIFKDGKIVETIRVEAGKYYNSRLIGVQKPTVAITSQKTGDKLALNDRAKLTALAFDKDGEVRSVAYFVGNTKIGTAYFEPYSMDFIPTTPGATVLKAVATDNEGNRSDTCRVEITILSTGQTSYINRPWNIPDDKIMAVKFDNGGAEVACHDNEIAIQGGNNLRSDTGVETEDSNNGDGNIGYTNAGEWYEYTVDVQNTGVYNLSVRMSSAGGGAMHVEFDGNNLSGTLPLNSTGSWGTYKDTTIASIPLKAGVQVMRIYIDKTGMNLSSYKFTLTNGKMPPSANAGTDQVVTLPDNSVQLNGVAQAFSGAFISKYEWTQIDSNLPVSFAGTNDASTVVSGLTEGVYQFRLTVTDCNGLMASDDMVVCVKPANYQPIANPGSSRTIPSSMTELTLDGSLSVDPDGYITSYKWEQIDANNLLTMKSTGLQSPVVKISGFLPDQLYIFRLTVTDNLGLSASENVRIYVESTTGIDQHTKNSVNIFPNPFTDKILIDPGNGSAFKKLYIHSVTGLKIIEKDISGEEKICINTSLLKSGCYLLTLVSDHNWISRKIIK